MLLHKCTVKTTECKRHHRPEFLFSFVMKEDNSYEMQPMSVLSC